jgi:hypothetical protein
MSCTKTNIKIYTLNFIMGVHYHFLRKEQKSLSIWGWKILKPCTGRWLWCCFGFPIGKALKSLSMWGSKIISGGSEGWFWGNCFHISGPKASGPLKVFPP